MKTPHQNFLSSPHAKEFAKFADSAAMDAACEVALLTMVEQTPEGGDNPNADWSLYCRVRGAREVLRILREMHLPEPELKPNQFPNIKPPR